MRGFPYRKIVVWELNKLERFIDKIKHLNTVCLSLYCSSVCTRCFVDSFSAVLQAFTVF